MLKELKEFMLKGNVVDMAVWFIFGAAFATVVKSLVANIVMPPIGLLLWKVDFSSLYIALDGKTYESLAMLEEAGAPAIKYGLFINDTVGFLILGTVIFFMIKSINNLKKKEEEKEEEPAKKADDILLLEEIRDALVSKKKK